MEYILTRNEKIICSIIAIVVGWILNAVAWASTGIGPTANTFCLLAGIVLFIAGIIVLIRALSNRR